MIVKYDHDCQFILYECTVCKYTHKEYYNSNTLYTEFDEMAYGKDPFIKGETEFLYQEEMDYGPSRLTRQTVFACPRCGVLQIDVDGV